MKKVMKILPIIVVMVFLFGWLEGYRFTEIQTLPWDAKKIISFDTDYGKALLFEDEIDQTFGVAKIKRSLGVFYRFDGASYGENIEEGKPFEATGYGNDEKDGFLIGVKVSERSNIQYIAVGHHIELATNVQITLDDVKEHPELFKYKKIKNDYALFALDEYTEDTWTIRAFNENGELVADKKFGHQERYNNK